jgi:hypothetical protein
LEKTFRPTSRRCTSTCDPPAFMSATVTVMS